MRFTYDRAADALSIHLVPEASSDRTVRVAPDCNADLDARGRLVFIEILQASHYYPLEELERLGKTSDKLTLKEAAAEAGLAPTTLGSRSRMGGSRRRSRGGTG